MVLEKALRWVVIGGIFLLPFIALLVAKTLFFPYIGGKNFAFRIIIEVITVSWLALALLNPQYRPRRSWILGSFAVFVIVIAIADSLGPNVVRSFWSNFERMEGWITIAHLFAYFTVAASVLHTEGLWRRFWQVSLGASVIVALYGLLQLSGVLSISPQSGIRLDATFGNATYLGGYMLVHIFIAALLWSQEWIERSRGRRLLISVLYGAVIALHTVILFFTATRGAILGLLGGALFSALILIALAPRSRVAWRAGAAVLFLLVLVGGFYLARDTAIVKRIEPLRRLASISTSETTVAARFMNWGMAWQGVKERPLLGWGQENYGLVFDKYYDPGMYASEPWFDRVHNIMLDWLIAGGVLGFGAYLSIFLAALYSLWKRGVFLPAERAILTGLLAAYMFHNLFVFDNVISYLFYASLFAYIASRAWEARGASPLFLSRISPRLLPGVVVVAVILTWGTAWWVNADVLSQNRALLQGLAQHPEGLSKNLEYFKKAIALNRGGAQEAREQMVLAATRLSQISAPDAVKQEFYQTAVQEMVKQAEAVPLEARFPLFLGLLLETTGDFENAKIAFARARSLSPNKQTIIFQLGSNAFNKGNNAEAITYFKEAFELEPNYNDARNYYAIAAIRTGDMRLADELLIPLGERGLAPDQRVVASLAAREDFGRIAALWSAYIEKHPEDAQARFTLAASYFAGGNNARAIQTLEEAGRDFPPLKAQADSLIQKIRDGTAVLE